jgi:hypothetical protein
MILAVVFALAMPRLEGGAETYEHLEGLLGGTRPLLDVLAPSPAPSSEYLEVVASPAPRSWTEWMEVWSSPGAATTRLAHASPELVILEAEPSPVPEEVSPCGPECLRDWTGACGVHCVIEWLHDATAKTFRDTLWSVAERPARSVASIQVEWDNLMAECVQNPDRYAEYLGGALTTGDVMAQVPGVLERCAVHEATCGVSLAVCDWLRDEQPVVEIRPAPLSERQPEIPSESEQPVVYVYSYYQSCDCLLLLLFFVVLPALACASCRPRPPPPLVVEAEPVKVV